MENFLLHIVANPILYIGYALSVLGAVGALLFIAGIGGGISHLFTYSESSDHMDHARTRALWGLYLCMAALGMWEIIRVLLGETPVSTLLFSLILLTPVWIPWLRKVITGKGGGH